MSITSGQIGKQGSSYRQGLVLGLTMAEIMLLLVFCLLIALAAFVRKEQSKRIEAEAKVERLSAELRENETIASPLQNEALTEKLKSIAGSSDPQVVDQYWRELVQGQATADELKKDGLTLKEIRDQIAQSKAMHANGTDAEKAIRDANAIAAINREIGKPGQPPVSTQDILDALHRGAGPGPSGHQWPPIINLSEAGGNSFKSGSAELEVQFRDKLLSTVPREILQYIKQYDVDVIEVVGHTDEQPIVRRPSNLDTDLLPVLKNAANVATLVPADNAGLGLARAVSVVSVLRQSPLLSNYKLIPLSGAQLVNTDETLAIDGTPADLPERRRIEIRLRKSSPHEVTVTSVPPPPATSPKRRAIPRPAPMHLLPKQISAPIRFLTPPN